MNFEKLCKLFLMKEPFYGIILTSYKKEECKQISTLGVTPDGDSFKLVYNPDWVGKFSEATIFELLKHEMEHICFDHMFMGKETGFDETSHKLFNVACDLECNSYLNRNAMDKEVGGCWAEDYKLPKEQGSKYYFRELLKNYKGEEEEQKMTGTHDLWGDLSDEQIERMKRANEEVLISAAEAVEKSYSSDHIPEALRIKIDKIRKKKMRPVTDWRRYCRRYLGNEFSYLTKKSRRRESKRFECFAGTRHMRNSRILAAIDTSGSVTMPEYIEFMRQLQTMRQCATVDVVECDTEIRHKYTLKNTIPTHLHGGGGTCFQQPIDLFNTSKAYDCLVYFTDGECDIPKDTPKDTLWVVSSKGQRNNNYYINGAKAVFIPKSNETE